MDRIKTLVVKYDNRKVGTLALTNDNLCAFQYDQDWLNNGFPLNPYSLPLVNKVFIPKFNPLDGLFGVFHDSLPDGWGQLLLERLLVRNKLNPFQLGQLDRLAIVGQSGMGALTYEPEINLMDQSSVAHDLDQLANKCRNVLNSDFSDNLDELFRLGGSSGGARPKILTSVDGEKWIIKFPSSLDPPNIGQMEHEYSQCAKSCGIEMTETRLFESKTGPGYFGIKRFDRVDKPIHMISAGDLLETSHRIPNLDYDILFRLTLGLTKDFSEVLRLYRLMCFNVFAHNRDDHSKNFSFLYDEESKHWSLSPAYDLTYSHSIGGEHATAVNGNGSNPSHGDLIALGTKYGISEKEAKKISMEIELRVKKDLGHWLK